MSTDPTADSQGSSSGEEASRRQASSLVDRLIEIERIESEGPTLRIVAENMRSLLACAAMFIVIRYAYTNTSALPYWTSALWLKFVCIVWGIWVFIYTLLAALQTGVIMVYAIIEVSVGLVAWKKPKATNTAATPVLDGDRVRKSHLSTRQELAAYLLALLVVFMVFGTFYLVSEAVVGGFRK